MSECNYISFYQSLLVLLQACTPGFHIIKHSVNLLSPTVLKTFSLLCIPELIRKQVNFGWPDMSSGVED